MWKQLAGMNLTIADLSEVGPCVCVCVCESKIFRKLKLLQK